jgi:hypothetical protein
MINVIWALNHAQRPVKDADSKKIIAKSFHQIIETCQSPEIQLIIISSSTGSVIAAQTATPKSPKGDFKICPASYLRLGGCG